MENVPPFVIFSDQTLRDICLIMPKTIDELLQIKGIGKQKKVKYGTALLEVIKNHTDTLPKNVETISKAPSHLQTLELYQTGKSIKEIAMTRKLSPNTIEDHLIRCAEERLVSLKRHIPQQFEEILRKVAKEYHPKGLKAIREALPENISYFTVKAFLIEFPVTKACEAKESCEHD